MKEWKEYKLGTIGITYSGLTGKTKNDFGIGSAHYISFLNVLNNPIIDIKSFERVIVGNGEKQNRALKGDLFFNTSSETPEEVGICAMLNDSIDDLYLNSFCFGYRVLSKDVYPLYLSYFFRSKQGRLLMSSLAQGVTRYNISKKAFNERSIKLPPLSEQTRIASALSEVDALLTSLDKVIAKKQAIKEGTMQQLLTGKTRLEGFEEEWKEYSIEELFDLGNGYTPSKEVPEFWNNGSIPWFRMEDIRKNGRILKDSIQHITPLAVKGGRLFPKNSIIISTTATIGEHALLIADSLANQRFTFLNRKVNRCETIDIIFFFHYCTILGAWCRENINEGGLAAVNMEEFKAHSITIPPSITEQQAIASILTSMDSELSALQAKRKKYEAIKQGMMQQLLTGKVRLV